MLKAIIVDDEKKGRELVKVLLAENCHQVEVAGMAANSKEALDLIKAQSPDIVFLDIEMPGGSGFDLLKKFTAIPFAIIFITAHDEYAIKAFKYSPLDYILKPVNRQELVIAVNKVEKTHKKQDILPHISQFIEKYGQLQTAQKKILLPDKNGLEMVQIQEIIRCEADRQYTLICLTTGKRLFITKTLKEIENMLSGHSFFRVHHSHLINLNFIKTYYRGRGGHVTMIDGTTVEVAQRRKDEFLDSLNKI